MNPREVVQHMIDGIRHRAECLELAFDRGLGEGMKIEKWMLTEMLAKLIELRNDHTLDSVEGEHKYPQKRSSRYEHCDLWWCENDVEHWLEVKTLKKERDVEEVVRDLQKKEGLRDSDVFYHLSILLLESPTARSWTERLFSTYQECGFLHEGEWSYELAGDQRLSIMLFSARAPLP